MRKPFSLTLRLTLFFSIAAAVVFPLFGWIIDRSMQHHFDEEDSVELEMIANVAQELLAELQPGDEAMDSGQRFDGIPAGHRDALLHIVSRDGRMLYASPGPDLSTLVRQAPEDATTDRIFQWQHADRDYRVLVRHMGGNGMAGDAPYTVIAAVSIDHHLRFLQGFRRSLWLMSASGIIIMSFMGWLAVRQGHLPLRRITARIRETGASRLHTQIPPGSLPAELADLAISFNEMLRRIEEAFVRLSNFSADIAHELRTPVANLMTQTQVALSGKRSEDEYRRILYSNLEEYERLAQMTGDMLFLAQSDHGLSRLDVSELHLEEEVRALFDYYEAWVEERGVTLELSGSATMLGDQLMLRRALGNLLSNAIHHTPPDQTVSVRLAAGAGGEIEILVENPGAIPAEHLPRLFDRFYRVDPSRQRSGEGAGLGLAIVKSIIEAHGGTIEVTSVAGRIRFRIRLPASGPGLNGS